MSDELGDVLEGGEEEVVEEEVTEGKEEGKEGEEEVKEEEPLSVSEQLLEEEGEDKEDDPGEDGKPVNEDEVFLQLPNLKGLKDKYPKILSEFPQLKVAYYLARDYRNVFPSLQAGKEALSKSNVLTELETDIFRNRSSKALLTRVKEGNSEAFKEITADFLETVHGLDQDAYYAAVAPLYDNLIAVLDRSDNDEHKAAAKLLHGLINPDRAYGETKVDDKGKKKLDRDKEEFEATRREDFNRRHSVARNSIIGEVEKAIKANVVRNLKDVEISGYLKDQMATDVITQINSTLGSDTEYQKLLEPLWAATADAGFSEETLAKITRAILGRVRRILPRVRGEIRSKAMVGEVKRDNDGKPTVSSGKSTGKKRRISNVDARKMTDLELLADDIVLTGV